MSNEELVKMARLAQRDDRMATGALYGDLADRIKELEREAEKDARFIKELCDQISSLNDKVADWSVRAEVAEAKLAKAVEALRFLIEATTVPEANICITCALTDARALLAEIDGEPLGAEFEAVWDANKAELYQG
jgi:hypothetical protein